MTLGKAREVYRQVDRGFWRRVVAISIVETPRDVYFGGSGGYLHCRYVLERSWGFSFLLKSELERSSTARDPPAKCSGCTLCI